MLSGEGDEAKENNYNITLSLNPDLFSDKINKWTWFLSNNAAFFKHFWASILPNYNPVFRSGIYTKIQMLTII